MYILVAVKVGIDMPSPMKKITFFATSRNVEAIFKKYARKVGKSAYADLTFNK